MPTGRSDQMSERCAVRRLSGRGAGTLLRSTVEAPFKKLFARVVLPTSAELSHLLERLAQSPLPAFLKNPRCRFGWLNTMLPPISFDLSGVLLLIFTTVSWDKVHPPRNLFCVIRHFAFPPARVKYPRRWPPTFLRNLSSVPAASAPGHWQMTVRLPAPHR